MVQIRAANEGDSLAILALLEAEALDTSDLCAADFVVAEDTEAQRVIGCARLKRYPDCVELSSVAVHPDYRGRGIGSQLVESLLQKSDANVIHLICDEGEVSFFARFGFQVIDRNELPSGMEGKYRYYETHSGPIAVMKLERKPSAISHQRSETG